MNITKFFIYLIFLASVFLIGCNPESASSTTPVISETALPTAPTALPTQSLAQSETSNPTTTAPATDPTSLPTQVEIAGPWQVVKETSIQHATTVAGFFDIDHGITAGPGGEVHYTTDGGEHWPEATNSSLCRFGLEIVDEQVAWHCGNGGHVRVSADGGQTWQVVTDYGPNEPRHCRFLSFLDDEVGWAATPIHLGATTDGGVTWTDIVLPEGIQKIAAIALRTSSDGYLLDTMGNLFITKDGGESWTTGAISLTSGEELIDFSAPMAAMRWFDGDNGLVVITLVADGESKVVALRTADGGLSWDHEVVPAKIGAPFLTPDGQLLTITHLGNKISVLQHQDI